MSYSRAFFIVITLITSFYYASPVFAHAPHDVVKGIVISSNFSKDNTVYSLVRSNILKSTDRGITWKRLVRGLDNTSSFVSLTIDPIAPNILYLSSVSDGIYKSENAGQSWQKINQGLGSLNINQLYVPPTTGHKVVFAVGTNRALYRTVTGGANWIKVYDNPTPLSAIAGFSWDSTNGRNVLIGNKQGGLFISINAGLMWTKIRNFPNCGEITTIATSYKPLLRNTFFLGTSLCGIFRTIDGGKSFQQTNTGINDLNIRSIVMSSDFETDTSLFASAGTQGAFISTDGGLTWQKQRSGLTTTIQAPIGKDFGIIGVSPGFKNDKTLFLAGFNGLFKSVNGGMQWQEMNTMPRTLIQSIALSPSYNTDKTLALATYVGGLYNSINDGKSWNSIANTIASRNSDIIFSPSYPVDGAMLVSISNPSSIGKSTDYGKSWSIQKIDYMPTIFAISPAFMSDQTLFIATRTAHVLKSSDGGKTFSSIYDEGHLGCAYCISGLIISPDFSNDQTVLLATSTSSGVHISHDGGNTWSGRGLKTTFGQQIKLAISPNYGEDKTIFIGGTLGLFRSEDGFETWAKISDNARGVDGYIEELAISPNFKNDNTLIISVRGKGLFKSQDRGWTFRAIGTSLINTNNSIALWDDFPVSSSSLIRFSPTYATDKTIFATSSDWLYRSRDGGETWAAILHHSRL